jgi:hypothetical protein
MFGILYGRNIMSKPILCSELISAFTQPKRAIALYQGGRIADDMIRKKQADLVKSQKFVLSESLVENAFDVSMQKPSVLLEMMENVKILEKAKKCLSI